MPTVNERIESRDGSLDTSDFVFFPYTISGSSGTGSGAAPGTTLQSITSDQLAEIIAAGGGIIDNGSSGSGSSGCSSGAGYLFSPTGRYTRKFQVITTGCETTLNAKTAVTASGIPLLGSAFPADPYSLAVSKTADSEGDDPGVWYVTVEYSRDGNPLLMPWSVDWDFNTFTVAVTEDIHGVKITNSALKPFDPPIEIEQHRFSMTLSRNVATWSLGNAILFFNSINSGDVTMAGYTFSARKLKCNAWTAKSFEHLGQRYWRETIVIEFNPDTWLLKVADVGFVDINGKLFKSEGWSNNTPVPLNADGTFRNPGDPVLYVERNSLTGIQVYRERDFCELNLNYGG